MCFVSLCLFVFVFVSVFCFCFCFCFLFLFVFFFFCFIFWYHYFLSILFNSFIHSFFRRVFDRSSFSRIITPPINNKTSNSPKSLFPPHKTKEQFKLLSFFSKIKTTPNSNRRKKAQSQPNMRIKGISSAQVVKVATKARRAIRRITKSKGSRHYLLCCVVVLCWGLIAEKFLDTPHPSKSESFYINIKKPFSQKVC